MDAFEVYVNGEKVCTAGVRDGIVTVTARAGRGFGVQVGGLDAAAWEYLAWPAGVIAAGDEVRIVAVETEAVDAPASREAANPKRRVPDDRRTECPP